MDLIVQFRRFRALGDIVRHREDLRALLIEQ